MYAYVNKKTILDINAIVTDLKLLLEKVCHKLKNFTFNKDESIDELLDKYSDDEFLEKIEIINNLSNDIMGKLEILDFFEQEYYSFLSIHESRKEYIFNQMIDVPNHTKKNKKILSMIEKENLRDNLLHGEDENILFDANFLKTIQTLI